MKEKNLLQFPAELSSYKTYKTTQNISCTFDLQEALEPDHLAQLIAAKGQTGWLVFNPTQERIKIDDIPDEPVREVEQKSKSQRLRAVLFLWWKSLKRNDDFQYFYDSYMEKMIEEIKMKLPPTV